MTTTEKNNQFSQLSIWYKILLFLCSPVLTYYLATEKMREKQKQKNLAKAKDLCKHFEIEITSGFWSPKIKLKQRQKPLSAKEVDEFFNPSQNNTN